MDAVANIEFAFRSARINRIIVLDDLDYVWHHKELRKLNKLRKKGLPVLEIIEQFDRDPDEVVLALIYVGNDEKLRIGNYTYVIILEYLDFIWDWPELRELKTIWEHGFSIGYAAEYFDRCDEEITLAIMHLAREGKIQRRRGGLF